MKWATAAACGLVALSCLMNAPARAGNRPEGTWASEDGGLKVRISDCGGSRICGTVVWLGEPIDPRTGKPKTDIHNPDSAKRSRPLIGLRVGGFRPDGPRQWAGSIYNADDGHTYRAYLIVQEDGTLRLQGCVLHVLCRGHTWTRTRVVARNMASH
jgi:uncharacterized protein (DUF2147 family)